MDDENVTYVDFKPKKDEVPEDFIKALDEAFKSYQQEINLTAKEIEELDTIIAETISLIDEEE